MRYTMVSGVFFALLTCVQLLRVVMGWPVRVASVDVPVWASVVAAVEVVEALHLDTASVEHGDLQVGLVARAVHAQQGFLAVARSLTALAKAGQHLVLASAEQTHDQNNPYASSQETSHASLCRMLEGGSQLRTMTKISALGRRRVQRS